MFRALFSVVLLIDVKAYFLLQYKMFARSFEEIHLPPILGFLLSAGLFAIFTEFLFYKTYFAAYLLPFAATVFFLRLSEKRRVEFLQQIFGNKKFKIRLAENLLVSLPFLLFLLIHSAVSEAVSLLAIAILFAPIAPKRILHFTLPTPFSSHLFEFTTGFRKTFPLFLLAYLLTGIAVQVNNFNLGIFALLLLFFTASSFYSKPENEYFVWIYAKSPRSFLFGKMKDGSKNIIPVVFPILSCLLIFYPENWSIVLLAFAGGNLFLWLVIMAKYAAFPNEISIPEALSVGFSVIFPPFLLVSIPYFYHRSLRNLNQFLDD